MSSESGLKIVGLDVHYARVAQHFDRSVGEVLGLMNEQEVGDRATGDISLTITCKFSRNSDGCTVHTASKVKGPPLVTDGVSAMLRGGKLVLIDAEQQELEFHNVTPLERDQETTR